MKQQGKTWVDAQGNSTDKKYLPDYLRRSERNSQKIADLFEDIEDRMRNANRELQRICSDMLLHYIAKTKRDPMEIKTFSFTSFDRQVMIEVERRENVFVVKCSRATKSMNPGPKDYEEIKLDINQIKHEAKTEEPEVQTETPATGLPDVNGEPSLFRDQAH